MSPNVMIYTKPGCSASDRTKELLDRAAIEYVEADLGEVSAHFESQGLQGSPVVTAPNLLWSGFKPGMIGEL